MVPEEGVARLKPRRSRHLLRSKLLANATQLSSGGIGQIPGGGARVFRAPKVALSLANRSAPEAGSTPIDRLWEKTGAGGGGRTLTALRPRDFESRASASSTTPAQMEKLCISFIHAGTGKSKPPCEIIHGDIR